MKIIMWIVGVIAFLMGAIWFGQGMGWITYTPVGMHPSFMIGDRNWVYWGGALAALGLLIIWRARR